MLKFSAVQRPGLFSSNPHHTSTPDNISLDNTTEPSSSKSSSSSSSEKTTPPRVEMSLALQTTFQTNLQLITNSKIIGLFQRNLQTVLCDQGLPEFIKELLVDKMASMARILGNMASRSTASLLLDSQGQSHFDRYAVASLALKMNLIQHNNTAGVTFSGRSLKLFSWCQAELKETAHPIVNYLLDKLPLDSRTEVEGKFGHLADISNLLILQIACGDDIADNIQNGVLVPLFVSIPIPDAICSQKGIKTRAESRDLVRSHNHGIYLDYYDVAVTIWDDCIIQLRDTFGTAWTDIEPGFLALHEKVMGSLTYSLVMNQSPHDKRISEDAILEKLAPNMMVECFRFLEKSLAQQIAIEHTILLPASDIALCDAIVFQSQITASLANATATAAREMRENDISNPIPFALNNQYMATLRGNNEKLGDVFETFLVQNNYRNYFFAQYEYDDDQAPTGFDILDLQLLRKVAMRRVMETLGALNSRGMTISEDDYSLANLASTTLSALRESNDELALRDARTLNKLTTHIRLIDQFCDNILAITQVETRLFLRWQADISQMMQATNGIEDTSLRVHAKAYVNSWEDFLCMYLLFKRAFDGTILEY